MVEVFSSIDIIILSKDQEILLIRRDTAPFKGKKALIGGSQQPFEGFDSTISRVIKQKLGINAKVAANTIAFEGLGTFPLIQFKTYDSGTDPRGGNTTVFAVETDLTALDFEKLGTKPFEFTSREELPALAFDHLNFIKDFFFFHKNYAIASLGEIGVTVDIVILTVAHGKLQVLLTKRSKNPFKGQFTLPGGFVDKDVDISTAALNLLKRDTNISGAYLEQLYTFGNVDRDPRGRIISITFYALLDQSKFKLSYALKYEGIGWYDLHEITKLELGFDHREIINMAVERIKNKIEYTNIAFQLLPEKFTLSELQEVYEIILERPIDKRNFRKKIAEVGMVNELNEFKKVGRMRPARYYQFKERTKETLLKAKKWV